MDDFFDNFSDDEDEFVSDGNVYDNEEDDYENHLYGGEEDGVDEEEFQDEEEVEEDLQDEEEVEEDLEDEMEDYDEEEVMEYGEQQGEEDIVVDQDGIEILDEVDEDLVDFEDEEEEEVEEDVIFEDEEDQDQLFEDEEEEELFEDDEAEYEGDDGNEDFYEDQTDSEDEFAVAPPVYFPRPSPVYFPRPTVLGRLPVIRTRPRSLHLEGESSELSGDERGDGGFGRNWREGGDGTATSRPTENNSNASDGNVVASKGAGSSGSNDSSWNGFQGPICPICYENWTGEGQHCVCCLPCGHLYGLSCITIWLQRPNSQKCPQCNDECELEDVRRLYGMQLPTTGVEELQKKVKSLEAKCASLELKDADWLIKEAEWKKKEADLKQQLNQHKEAEAGVAKDIVIQAGANERCDPVENPEPSNALSQMKL